MKKIQLLVFLTLLSFSGFGQILDSKQKKTEKLLVLDRKSYTIDIPAGWKVENNCKDEWCDITSPFDTLGLIDRYLESINFAVNKLPSANYSVDQYAAFSIKYLPTVVKNFSIIEKKKLKSNAYRLTYKGEKDKFKQTWRQYYYIKNAKVYIVTFACETEKYAYYQPLVEPYLNSFRLK